MGACLSTPEVHESTAPRSDAGGRGAAAATGGGGGGVSGASEPPQLSRAHQEAGSEHGNGTDAARRPGAGADAAVGSQDWWAREQPQQQPQPPWGGARGAQPKGAACNGSGAALQQQPSAALLEDIVGKVTQLQRELALVSGHPLLALPEAAELLAEHLGVDVVGIYAFAPDRPNSAILMAACGLGCHVLERWAVVRGMQWSPVQLWRLASAPGAPAEGARLFVQDAACWQGKLPDDFVSLNSSAGIRSMAEVTVGPPGDPLGVLLLGKRGAGGFNAKWTSMFVDAASTSLLQHLRHAQVAQAAKMVAMVDETPDPVSAISVLLQSGASFMWRSTNVNMGVRLSLVEDGQDSALVFESARATASARDDTRGLLRGRTASLPADPAADVTVRELPLNNTLLASAVSLKKARFVKDCASYMQNCPTPARDVFTHASHMVSSVVVVPLLAGARAFGALYFTQDAPCDFVNIQDALLGFVHCLTLTLYNKLAGEVAQLKGMVDKATKARSIDGVMTGAAPGSQPLIRQIDSSDSDEEAGGSGSGGAGGANADSDPRSCESLVPPIPSKHERRLSKVSSRRLCTEAMLKVLQQEVRKGKRRSVELSFVGDHLVLKELLGRGGYGSVYRGTWHKRPAAIKVMNTRNSDSEAVSDAMEMAVLSSVQHPSIVQVFSCLTDMVEIPPDSAPFPGATVSAPAESSSQSGSSLAVHRAPTYRRMQAGEEELDVATFNIIVMEFCDRGTLGDAVRRAGLFHQRLPNGCVGVNLPAVLDVLIDMANALDYLHGISLLHGDVKLDNILLKTDPLRPLGVGPKLADFGLTKILRDTDNAVNHNGAGTITHLAPELFHPGTRLTTAIDTFAFGVMMWEFYTAAKPYAGLTREAIIESVARRGARPIFPAGTPRSYVDLATACWATSPVDRPAFSEIVGQLQEMADGCAEQAAAAPYAAPRH